MALTASCGTVPTETTPTPVTETEPTATPETSPTEPVPSGSPELLWIFVYENEDFAPSALAMHPDGELVTVGAYMATYTHRLYDSELTDVDTEYTHSVDSLSFSSDGKYLAAGLAVGGAWIKDSTSEAEQVKLHRGNNTFVAFGPNSSILATANRSGEVLV